MPLKKFGPTLGLTRQPDSELTYQSDGLISGRIVYIGDRTVKDRALALLGTAHPDDGSVTLYSVTERRLRAQRMEWTFDCIGLRISPTNRIPQFQPQLSTSPIETHPKFAVFAGTAAAPLNGAYFDPVSKAFDSFVGLAGTGEDAVAAAKKIGLKTYYTGSCTVRATHYTTVPPRFTEVLKIKETLTGLPEITGVKNWLYSPPSWDPIPNTKIYHVTEEWIGSSGPDGWDEDVYGSTP